MNKVEIIVPEGMEIDTENSTFECVRFKPKKLTYEDVAKKLFACKNGFYINNSGEVAYCAFSYKNKFDSNNATSEKQLQKLLSINQLMNVAKYLNGDWKPDWDNIDDYKWSISYSTVDKVLVITNTYSLSSFIYFKSKELAQQAIDILGKDTICLALSTDW